MQVFRKKKLTPYSKRRTIFQSTQPLKKAGDFIRTWEKNTGKSNAMIKEDKNLYARKPHKPMYKTLETDYDHQFLTQMQQQRTIKLYNIQDIQNELEQLTEDEEEMADCMQ